MIVFPIKNKISLLHRQCTTSLQNMKGSNKHFVLQTGNGVSQSKTAEKHQHCNVMCMSFGKLVILLQVKQT